MESPCVKTCTIDTVSGLCTGCGRTRNEIAMWTSISSAERRKIMNELPSRQKNLKR
ncbi:MAG: DUF1289 domain-containing protein [Hyphomicrobium sp.]|nr:DUF1289 domain-containing protein [Hyphomicrobium sp.]